MTTKTIHAIERHVELRAAPDRVWQALTDSLELSKWFSQRANIRPEAGSDAWFEWDGHGRFQARIESVEPGRRIAWRGATQPNRAVDDGPTTLVEWAVEPAAQGGTILRLRESGFETEESLDGNTEGWLEELTELRDSLALEAWDHPIRRTLELDVDRERIWQALTDRDELLEWWGPLSQGLRVEAGSEGWFEFPEHGAHAVRFETVDPPRYIAWRWVPGSADVAIEEAAEATVVEWVLQPRPGGGTTLHLVESGFRGPQKFEDNSSGWDEILPGLARLVEAG